MLSENYPPGPGEFGRTGSVFNRPPHDLSEMITPKNRAAGVRMAGSGGHRHLTGIVGGNGGDRR